MNYDYNYYYYTVGAQFLEDEDGNLVDTILFGTSNGLDASTQPFSSPIGFVTSVSDDLRINPFLEDTNSVLFEGQDAAAS